MPYNFNFSISADISAKVVEDMLKSVIEEQTGKKVSSIQFKRHSESDVFDGCTVCFINEPIIKKIKASDNNGFVADTYK